MSTVTVRVHPETYRILQDMARESKASLPDTLERVVEEARRARIFKQAHEAYAALIADPEAYAEWRAEFDAWDVTIADGLEPESFDEP